MSITSPSLPTNQFIAYKGNSDNRVRYAYMMQPFDESSTTRQARLAIPLLQVYSEGPQVEENMQVMTSEGRIGSSKVWYWNDAPSEQVQDMNVLATRLSVQA